MCDNMVTGRCSAIIIALMASSIYLHIESLGLATSERLDVGNIRVN